MISFELQVDTLFLIRLG